MLLLFTVVGRYFILGRASVVRLPANAALSTIGTSLQDEAPGSYLPIEGKDYIISKVTYFDDRQWVVVSTDPVGTASDPALVVLKKSDNTYRKVLGPSGFFQGNDLTGLPNDLKSFLEHE